MNLLYDALSLHDLATSERMSDQFTILNQEENYQDHKSFTS